MAISIKLKSIIPDIIQNVWIDTCDFDTPEQAVPIRTGWLPVLRRSSAFPKRIVMRIRHDFFKQVERIST
jgi:hypothetical protein